MEITVNDEIQSLLATFRSLSTEDQSAALRLLEKSHGSNSSIDQHALTPSETFISRAHTCPLCQKLKLHLGEDRTTFPLARDSGTLHFSKEDLVQGLAQKCLLVEWVLSELERSLFQFKSRLGSEGLTPTTSRGQQRPPGPLDNLDYIDAARGVQCTVSLRFLASGGCVAVMTVSFSNNALLMDKLYRTSHYSEQNDFQRFYSTSIKYGRGTGHHMKTFHAIAIEGDPAGEIIRQRPKMPSLSLEDSLNLARGWFDECCSSHGCRTSEDPLLPSRVIDVGTRYPVRSVRLHWADEGERARYACLTYCWGGPQPLSTRRANAQDFTDGILVSKLPNTLQDAITTTFKLGLRYIWIDCLCIIQDDEEDVSREIGAMSRIYSEASVTFSAAGANTVYGGFLGRVKHSQKPSLKVTVKSQGNGIGTLYMERPKDYAVEDEPINLRAWSLQEHVLSQRILMFGSQDIWWVCPRETRSQDGIVDSTEDKNRAVAVGAGRYIHRAGKMDAIAHWRRVLQDYTGRFLTFPHDKLPAIAGIAAMYGTILGDRYLAGLWGPFLKSELFWSPKRSDITRPVVPRAPSWSWASVDSEITHDWCPQPLAGDFDILHCEAPPLFESAPFGAVNTSKSRLCLSGLLGQFYWTKERDHLFLLPPEPEDWVFDWPEGIPKMRYREIVASTIPDAEETIPTVETGDGNEDMVVWAFMMTRYPARALLLARVNDEDENVFRRVGIVYRFDNSEEIPKEKMVAYII